MSRAITLKITDYVIDIENTSLEDRQKLKQVLVGNEQKISTMSTILYDDIVLYYINFKFDSIQKEWCGTSAANAANISLKDFVAKFDKQKQEPTQEDWEDLYNDIYGVVSATDIVDVCNHMESIHSHTTRPRSYEEYIGITNFCSIGEQHVCKHYLTTNNCTGCNAWYLTTNQQKEKTMNSTALQQLLTQIFGTPKPETDYDKRPAYLVVAYSADGQQVAQATATSEKDVKQKVQQTPGLWNCRVLTYKLDKELSVNVPVTSVKATTASGEPNE